jgi:fucose permease
MCGRPLFEAAAPEVSQIPLPALPSQPSPAPRLGPPPVGFGNPIALRVAIVMALGMMLAFVLISLVAAALQMIGLADVLCLIISLGTGWIGVGSYSRITRSGPTIAGGARLGWIAGFFTALTMATLVGVALLLAGDQLLQQFAKQNPQVSASINPANLGPELLFGLVTFFFLIAGTCAAGGALGARYVSRNGANTRV